MKAAFCVDCLEDALREHDRPEVFYSARGSQFTSDDFTGVLKRDDITTAKAGHGWAYDNIFVERLWRSVKHEDVYLNGYATMECWNNCAAASKDSITVSVMRSWISGNSAACCAG